MSSSSACALHCFRAPQRRPVSSLPHWYILSIEILHRLTLRAGWVLLRAVLEDANLNRGRSGAR
jgi:hypothetical protein